HGGRSMRPSKPVRTKRITGHDDAFGLEMLSYLKGGSPFEIVERDDGYIEAARSTAHYFARFEHWPRRQQLSMRFVNAQHVLDVGCGAGRVSLYLQEKDVRVTAIDTSRLAIQICQQRGVKDAQVLGIEDIGHLHSESFDTVILFGNNFGLFGNFRKAQRLLKQLHQMTTDGAVLIAETINPYKTNNPFHRRYQRQNRQRGRMAGQIRIRIRFQGYASRWFDYLFVSPHEMKKIVKGTGWKLKRFIESDHPSYVAVIGKV
ncbi:MAG TPA: class I SAM-dependent methyltransferase, partial [Vicinamibacterales bacterium]|nr:class I SAM-dependent methyltransferase [Vicinamibacterales bacterium]